MANYQAVLATSVAICNVLRQSRAPDLYGPDIANVECRVFTTANFSENIPADGEVALFPYRVDINPTQRTLPPDRAMMGFVSAAICRSISTSC